MGFQEFFQEIISTANLPFTVLLAVVMLYWLLVMAGAVGMDAFDFDLDVDTDIDIDADMGMDAGAGGAFGEVLAFMHLGQVPLMIVGTLVVFFLWICTVLSNYYMINGVNVLYSVLLFVPNLLVSMLLTKAVIWPFLQVSEGIDAQVETREKMIGMTGAVKTSEVTESFGQVEIAIDGPAIVINARTGRGEKLLRGDCAKIEAYDNASDTFRVSLSKWEKE